MMKASSIFGALLFVLASVTTCELHAQVFGGDPLNNLVCPADMSGAQCAEAGYGGTRSGGGSGGTTTCRSYADPSTYCFTPTFDRYGHPTNRCDRGYVGTGYCICTSGKMSGSCSVGR